MWLAVIEMVNKDSCFSVQKHFILVTPTTMSAYFYQTKILSVYTGLTKVLHKMKGS